MLSRRAITGVIVGVAIAAAPVFAADGQRRRSGSDRRGERAEQGAPSGSERARERAVPRSRDEGRQNEIQRQNDDQRRQDQARQQSERRYQADRQREAQRQFDRGRDRNDHRGFDRGDYRRPYYSNRGPRLPIRPRIIRPRIVTVVPYRPYHYRPSLGIGIYYGSGGSYPYGYTPRGYYDPYPGRPYGGVRIAGAPREAHVFADGYYVGIVNDFDGVFQHMNLEAGPHHIEIEDPGFEPIAFDVVVQPGRTITFHADLNRY